MIRDGVARADIYFLLFNCQVLLGGRNRRGFFTKGDIICLLGMPFDEKNQ